MAQLHHPRHLRLLTQFASKRIDDLLTQNTPPLSVYDMTTWRLERPDSLLEVVESVIADPGFEDTWPIWKVFKKTLYEVAMPAWVRGREAFIRASTKGVSPERLEGLVEDSADLGVRVALNSERGNERQMWFYEGWLCALDEENDTP